MMLAIRVKVMTINIDGNARNSNKVAEATAMAMMMAGVVLMLV